MALIPLTRSNLLLDNHYLLLGSVGHPQILDKLCLGGLAMEFTKEVVLIARILVVSNKFC